MVDRDNLEHEFNAVKEDYPGLFLLDTEYGTWIVRGNLHYHADYNKKIHEDEYIVEILVSSRYPYVVPHAKEVGGRIPKSFHTNPDNTLCLGAPIRLKRKFSSDPTLIGFINNCLIPYLFAHSYKEQRGKMPFGELAHGTEGVLQCYIEEFRTKDIGVVLELLDCLTSNIFPGYKFCPCKSGRRLFECHGDIILEMKGLQLPKVFSIERNQIISYLKTKGK